MTGGMGLGDAIDGLRRELQETIDNGRHEQLSFTLSPIELTLNAVVRAEGKTGIRWYILEAGGSAAREATQTLSMTLTPRWRASDGTESVTEDFTIASEQSTPFEIGVIRPAER